MKNLLTGMLISKKKHPEGNFIFKEDIQKTVRVMKATSLFLLLGIYGASASTYAQTARLNVEAQGEQISEVLKDIEEQSEYTFVYDVNELDLNRRVSISAQDASVNEVLDKLFSGAKIKYVVTDRHIALYAVTDKVQQNSDKKTITGTVVDKDGIPVIGANIVEKGTTNGTVTDLDGKFSLNVTPGTTLQISYIGYNTQELKVGEKSVYNIALKEDAEALDELVVTALGLKREEKALGYAVQKVSGADLSTIKTVDIATSLTGKVAGMNVQNSTEFNAAPTILVRGEEPLIVVDGVPYSNISLRDIASDDVQSIDVLKGATASALYGARGGSGVIMITTKKSEKEGLDISINSSTMFNAGYLAIPEAQHSYSSGTGGVYDSYDYVWGDKLDIGRTAVQYNPYTYEWEEQPLVSKGKNNFRNFLEQGLSSNNNISLAWKGEHGGFRTSLNHVYNKGQYPNEKLQKLTYTISGNAKIGNLTFEGGAIWNKRFFSNNLGSGYGGGGYIYNLIVWTGANYDVRDYRDYWVKGKEHSQQNWLYSGYYDNPYFLAYECTNQNDYDKLNTYGYFKYDITPWLNISNRTGVDFYADRTQTKNPIGAINMYNKNGYFAMSKGTGFSVNSDFILSGDYTFGDFSLSGLFGGTIYYYYDDELSSNTNNGLSVPGYYSLNASVDPISSSASYESKRVNSLYGNISLSWRNLLYLDATGRNDWSSTLPAETRSYFYPSVSASLIMSEFIDLPDLFTFWKLRGSWTVTKSDLGIFDTVQAYSVSNNVWDGLNSATFPTSLRSSTLKPVTSRSYEIGTEFNVWENRLHFDFAFYNKLKYNLTREATISAASGFSSTLLNYEEEQLRRGYELAIGADLIKSKDWNWSININWARDRYYYAQVDPVYSTQNQWVQDGLRWDWLATYDWERDPDGSLILYNGLPRKSEYLSFVGYEYPDWIWGINTTLNYKNWTLYVAFDGRVGGTVYNQTEQAMWNSGSHPDSDTPERYEEVVNGNINYVAPGVKIVSGSVEYDTDGNIISDTRVFAPNDVAVSYQSFIQTYEPWSGSAAFQNYRSTTFFKIRELSLTYGVPKSICDWAHIKGASVSFIGQNLLLWAKEFKYADPDVDEDNLSSPSQRFLGFNVKVDF